MKDFMNTKIIVGLCMVLGAGCLSARADDTPAQATAREALEQRLTELDSRHGQPPLSTVTPANTATNVTGTVPVNAETPQAGTVAEAPATETQPPAAATTIEPIPTPVVEAPATIVPVAAAPAAVVPAVAASAVAAPAMSQPTPAPVATESSVRPVPATGTNEIETATGAIYRNALVEKVEPDGIIVSFTPAGGGLAITRISFDELSDELRKQYGFDPEKKLAYEKESKLAAAWWREHMITNYEAAIARRDARVKAEAEAEAQAKAEMEQPATNTVAAVAVTNQPQTEVMQPPPAE